MTGYTWIMEREVNGKIVREQAKAWSVYGIISVIRSYEMANLGWRIADLRYNDRVKNVMKESVMTIRELRTASGMTQQQFSEEFHIPKRSIENWEGGKRECPEYLLHLIEYYLKKENLIQ